MHHDLIVSYVVRGSIGPEPKPKRNRRVRRQQPIKDKFAQSLHLTITKAAV